MPFAHYFTYPLSFLNKKNDFLIIDEKPIHLNTIKETNCETEEYFNPLDFGGGGGG